MSDDAERQRAWEYHQHSDNLIHNRYNIFLVAQSIFVAAFAQADPGVQLVDLYLKRDNVYLKYLDAFKPQASDGFQTSVMKRLYRTFSADLLMNRVLPWLSIAAWPALVATDQDVVQSLRGLF